MEQESLFRLLAHTSLIIHLGVFVALLIHLKKYVTNRTSQFYYLALLFWFILASKDIAYFFGDIWYDTSVTNILLSMDLWSTPISGIIILNMLQPKWVNIWRVSAIFTPFLLFTLLMVITKGNSTLFIVNQVYAITFATIMGALLLRLSYKCERYIHANYSNNEQGSVVWVRYLIAALYTICLVWVFIALNTTWLGDCIYYQTTSLMIILLFYFSLKQKRVVMPNYMSVKKIFQREERYDGDLSMDENGLMTKGYIELDEKLEHAIKVDKVFLNPQLSLSDLAAHIGTNRTYLSKYINFYKNTPFINYINDMRLDEALLLLSEKDSKHSITEIAEKSGFASYSTFRRVFKQRYGYTPSEHSRK